MARGNEIGIGYFPMNTDIVHNSKVKLVVADFGAKALGVLLPLYCKIYREKGYWVDWSDDDLKTLFALDECKLEKGFVNEVVAGCLKRSLFDKGVFDRFGVLTSDRIQENYLEATKRRKSVLIISEFLLINNIEHDNVIISGLDVNILSKKVDINKQIKLNKSKVKESKTDVADEPPNPIKNLENRMGVFISDLKPFVDTYGADMVNDFYRYWSEPNKSKTKMRFEMQPTWDLKLRLITWDSRSVKNK